MFSFFFKILELLFLEKDTILELPSFTKSACVVDLCPEDGFFAPTGLVNNTLLVCGDTGCWSLQGGEWSRESDMTTPRYGAGSSSSATGWFLTGGLSDRNGVETGPILQSTELLVNGAWSQRPDLPSPLAYQCQVQVGQTVYIIGNVQL